MSQVPSKQVGNDAYNTIDNVDCDSSVAVGDWIRMSGGVAVKALGDSLTNSLVLGVCVEKTTSVLCTVRVGGVSEAIFAGLDETKKYFLSDSVSGGQQTTAPTGSGKIRLQLGQPFSATRMFVKIGDRVRRV